MAFKIQDLEELPKATRGGRGPSESTSQVMAAVSDKRPHLIAAPTKKERDKAARAVRYAAKKVETRVSIRITEDGVAFQGR